MADTQSTVNPHGPGARPQDEMQARLSRAREELAEYDFRVRRMVREHPVAAVAAAVAVGYFVGRITRR